MSRRQTKPAVPSRRNALLVTGDALSDRVLALAGFTRADLQRMRKVVVQGMRATRPDKVLRRSGEDDVIVEEGGPDHANRLRAAEDLAKWAGLEGSRKLEPKRDEHKPVRVEVNFGVAIVAGHGHANGRAHADAELRQDGLRVHLGGGVRVEPGNGGAGHAG